MKEEKIIGSVLYVTANETLQKQVEEELTAADPLNLSQANFLETLEIVDEDTKGNDGNPSS